MKKEIKWLELTKVCDGVIGVCFFRSEKQSGVVRIREELENDRIIGKVSFTHQRDVTLKEEDKTFIQKEFHDLFRS